MEVTSLIVIMIVSFCIIYFSVSLAIRPLVNKKSSETKDRGDSLAVLRDMDVLTVEELDKVIDLYNQQDIEKNLEESYMNCLKILGELNILGYIDESEYILKSAKLRNYFKTK